MMKYKFIYSIVIPIYNVEKYLEETILSVIEQDINFKSNIQMILVNDGSPDNCEEICLKYRDMYPDNIIYVKQENAGVSVARNTGMNYIEGKYVNFLDADDKWEPDALKKVYKFFEKHYDEVDLVSARMKFFEGRGGGHLLNYKFKESHIVDILEEFNSIQLHITSSVIKSEAARKYKFDKRIKFGEDALYVNSIILNCGKFGVVSNTNHMYRKRLDGSSAIQQQTKNLDFYFVTPKLFYQELFNISNRLYNKTIQYVQYAVMYDLQWRVNKLAAEVLTNEQVLEYKRLLLDLIMQIDDEIICCQKNLYFPYKLHLLSLKHGKYDISAIKIGDQKIFYNDIFAGKFRSGQNFKFNFMSIKDNTIHIEGKINSWFLSHGYDVYFEDCTGARHDFEITEHITKTYHFIDDELYHEKIFRISIPISTDNFSFKVRFNYINATTNLQLYFEKFIHLSDASKASYSIEDNWLLKSDRYNVILKPATKRLCQKSELMYLLALLKYREFKIIAYRIFYFLNKDKKNKKLWIISDRPNKANDNGEHLFKYINGLNSDIDCSFVIDKSSEDYKRIKSIGPVIKYNTFKYKLKFLLSDYIVSSQANDYVINPFGKKRKFIKDLYNFKYVFLQHGIIKDDLSGWLNRYAKDMSMFVTSGKPEYKSILDGNYLYDESVVKLTGLPRHDNLLRLNKSAEKKLLIIPTWRRSIKGSYDNATGESIYFEDFTDTDYFKFYNSLINNKKLLECMRKYNYKGLFCLHPTHSEQFIDFESNDCFKVNEGYVDYQSEFCSSSLLVTDYSSVFFDFAYLKKPVIYSQFDKDSFFDGSHVYEKGYFDYEDNGFGPVCYTLEETVDAIIKSIINDCKLDSMYLERINDFYAYSDGKNCERVYNEIINL